MARELLSMVAFPVTLVAVLVSAQAALDGGMDPGLVVALHVVVAGLITIVLERVNPHEPSWFGSRGDVGADWLHLAVSNVAVPRLVEASLVPLLFALVAGWLGDGGGVWPHRWPLAVQGVLALVIAELPYYWWHRLAHENAFLWRFHSVHHSAPRLYWLNAARFHPIDNLVAYTLQTAPLVLLGCGADVVAWFTVFVGVHGLFQHANIRVRLGPLNWVFSMAELHRWHHSTLEREGNTNYGGNLILWDVVFSTRFLPVDRAPPVDIGIGGMPNFPQGYLGQLLAPFRWASTVRESAPTEPDGSPGR